MKLPIQVVPVQRNLSIATYAMSSGIQASVFNPCACHAKGLGCIVTRNDCPAGWMPRCEVQLGAGCVCYCCSATGTCSGPYE
ncbi:hypothetical protein Cylst_1157 [Cylindrospermum stagnale PCC 7417]|uniref:Uncharacterized protein n=1 Tax=Cylindrospermum stagnale PCC 7417 TaxID=56107 RepID=K9WSU7_9NOST|nr:hypothetical protein Cylst_1157 [Cylindrospermum stagnale PCC 7417]